MREILYRGVSTDSVEWVEGWFEMYPYGRWPMKETIIPADEAKDGYFHHVEVIPETVGQFTGLTDKNGKRIFEGDIFSVTWSAKDRTPVVKTFVAVFKNGCFYARAFNGNQIVATIANYANCRKVGDTGVFVEVIGNIHDNPELLEE